MKLDDPISFQQLTPSHWVFGNTRFEVPTHWREWLGTIRIEEIEACDLFLLTKLKSKTPGVLDGENNSLQRRVQHFYAGLLLASPFAPAHKPVMVSGTCQNSEVDVRSYAELQLPIPFLFKMYPPLLLSEIQLAADLAEKIETIENTNFPGRRWRFFRTLSLYGEARAIREVVDRVHQYCRCIEGLLVPDTGQTKSQFRSRTELFIGPQHHGLMGDIFDIRSAVEHLHENRYLEKFDRETRLDLARKEAIVEYIARSSLVRIIQNENLWSHFMNTPALQLIWNLDRPKRERLWGYPIDPYDAVADFDPQYILNADLGQE